MTFPTILKALLLFGATAQALAILAPYSTEESISQIHDNIETPVPILDETNVPYVDVGADEGSPLESREFENDILDPFNPSNAFDEDRDDSVSSPSSFSSSPVINEPLSKRGWRQWWREFWEAKPYQ